MTRRDFDPVAKAFLKDLADAGWTGRQTTAGDFLAKSPDGVTLTVPRSMRGGHGGRNGDRARQTFDRWVREHLPAGPSKGERIVDAAALAIADGDTISADIIVAKGRGMLAAVEAEEPVMVVAPTRTVEPHRVRSEPWLAHLTASARGGTKYPSAAVTEVTWSDETVTYECSQGCGYTAPKPRSVASHYAGAHTAKGEGIDSITARLDAVPVADYTEPLTVRDYVPSERLILALAEWLTEGVIRDGAQSPRSLAESMLRWAHERPDLGDVEHRTPQALAPEQILTRIRELVGRPLVDDLETARTQAAEAQDAARQATEERDAMARTLAAVQRDLNALRDMIPTVGMSGEEPRS